MIWLIYLLITINLFSFLLFGFDKWRAWRHRRRIPEKVLFLITFFGGSLGSLAGMYTFRHKTSKTSFQIVVAVLILIQLSLLVWLIRLGVVDFSFIK